MVVQNEFFAMDILTTLQDFLACGQVAWSLSNVPTVKLIVEYDLSHFFDIIGLRV